jgi:hypothetical protein
LIFLFFSKFLYIVLLSSVIGDNNLDGREMAEKFRDFSGKYETIEAKEELIKERLKTCWWGPLAKKKIIQTGWEGVQDSDGFQ